MINTTKSITIELPRPLHEIIIEVVCGYYSTSKKDMFALNRSKITVDRRHILFYILHTETEMSDVEIGQLLGIGRRIVKHGIDKVAAEKIRYRNRYTHDINAISRSIKNLFNPIRDWVTPPLK